MSEPQTYSYATYLNVRFPALSLVDVPSLVDACTDRWYNQTLCKVNDSVVRLGVDAGRIPLAQARQRRRVLLSSMVTSSLIWKTNPSI